MLSPHLLSNLSSISTSKLVTKSYPPTLALPLVGPLSNWIQLIKTAANYLYIYNCFDSKVFFQLEVDL